jgi:hypothetical protein
MSDKWKFILKRGGLWALLTFAGVLVWTSFIRHQPIQWPSIIAGIVVWPLAGIAWGSSMWSWRESQLRKKNR